jgi:hypothetical protein
MYVRPQRRIGGKLDSFQAKMQPFGGQKASKSAKFSHFRSGDAKNAQFSALLSGFQAAVPVRGPPSSWVRRTADP